MLALLSALLVTLLASTACVGPGPAPTPDPFSSLSERADAKFREGLQAYQEGRFRDALSAFEQAKLLSPTPDPRVDEFIERSRQALQPTPTLGPPTATPAPPTPSPTPIFINRSDPDLELGERYFGQVFLSVVPGRNIVPPATNEFYFEDQVGLYIENLDQRLRLPFHLRVFDLDSGRLVALARNTGAAATPGAARPPGTPARGTPTPAGTPVPGATALATLGPNEFPVARFWDRFAWYHEGGEQPGRYRVELYANGSMTHAFDYLVGNVPVARPVAPVATPAFPGVEPGVPRDFEPPPDIVTGPAGPGGAAGAADPGKPPAAAPGAPAAPPPAPTPTFTPTPAPALNVTLGGVPAGLDVNLANRRVFVADASGVVWSVDRTSATLDTPFNLDRLPVDIAVDQITGNLYLSVRAEPGVVVLNGATGQRLATVNLPVNPADLQLDSTLGLLYAVLPERSAVAVIDVRSGNVIRTTSGLAQISGIALDDSSHTLYVSQLGGQISILDARTGQLVGRVAATGAGLSAISAGAGRVYAINTASRELVVFDPDTREITRFTLSEEPGAVLAGVQSNTVYVLGVRTNSVFRLNPLTGAEEGRVLLGARAGRFGLQSPTNRDLQGLRGRMAINRNDETVYVTQPETGTLSIIPPILFPPSGANGNGAALAGAGAGAGETPAVDFKARPGAVATLPPGSLAARGLLSEPAAVGVPTPTPLPARRILAPTPIRPAASAPRSAVGATPTRTPPPGMVLRGQNALMPMLPWDATLVPSTPTATPAPPTRVPPTRTATTTGRTIVEPERTEMRPRAVPTSDVQAQRVPDAAVAAASPVALSVSLPVPLNVPAPALLALRELHLPNATFYTQGNGRVPGTSTLGYLVSDSDGVAFWSGYTGFGGPQFLGYPVSHRFEWRGQTVQLTQGGLLRWSPAEKAARLGNLLDDLHDAGFDARLAAEQFVPRQLNNDSEAGLTFSQVKARRLALLEASPDIKARYFASPDPLLEFGLPTSRVVDMGPVVAMRTQRAVLQLWRDPQAWGGTGEVSVLRTGELALSLGLFGERSGAPFSPRGPLPFDPTPDTHAAVLRSDEYWLLGVGY